MWTKWLGVGGFVVGVKVTYQMWTKLEEAFAVRVRVTDISHAYKMVGASK